MNRLTASDFINKQQTEPCTIIDLRTDIEYKEERIENCIHLPVQDLDTERLEHSLQLAGDNAETLYLLCRSGKRAEIAVQKLGDYKRKLVIIEGGLNALKKSGLKTVRTSGGIISLERQVRIAAGALVLLGTLLSLFVYSGFIAIPLFVGAGLMFAGITDWCGMGMLLARMPWNKS